MTSKTVTSIALIVTDAAPMTVLARVLGPLSALC